MKSIRLVALLILVVFISGCIDQDIIPITTTTTTTSTTTTTTTLPTTTTTSTVPASTNQILCAGTYVNVISVTSDSVLITNTGLQTITSITCYASNGTSLGGLGSLAPGATNSITWSRGTQTSVICTGSCLNIGITGECKSGQGCWK